MRRPRSEPRKQFAFDYGVRFAGVVSDTGPRQ